MDQTDKMALKLLGFILLRVIFLPVLISITIVIKVVRFFEWLYKGD